MKNKVLMVLTLAVLGWVSPLLAQQEVEVRQYATGWGEKPIPITLSGFSGEAAQVLRFDLEVQGFKIVTDDPALQFDVIGSNSGNVKGQLVDHLSKQSRFSKEYTGGSARVQAHALADDIVAAVTGRKGIGQTKIAFKVDTGATSEIYVSDFDGHNAMPVTQDGAIVAAPVWVPGKLGLYYMSYKLGGSHIFSHNLSSGARSVFSRYNGGNLSPAVSPDGSKVAMILGKDGWVDLYVQNSDGKGLKRLTKSQQDESSPCWSPDGKWILFAGKDGERRVLRKVSPDGGPVTNVRTAQAPSPSEPEWSPDGKWIVFTTQRGTGFDLCIIPSTGGDAIALVAGEDPSWAPNSRTVIFARRSGNGRVLAALDVFTKQVKEVRTGIPGSNSQPSWAK